ELRRGGRLRADARAERRGQGRRRDGGASRTASGIGREPGPCPEEGISMITDRDRGDPPRRLHIAPLLWAGAHALVWSNPNVCFISATDDKGDDPPPSSEPGRRISTKEPPSSEEPSARSPGAAGQMRAPRKLSAEASLASILGAAGESPLALKTAAIGLRQVADTARGVTGKTDPSEVVGGLLAIPEKLERGRVAREELAQVRADADAKERRILAFKLADMPGMRSKVLADVLDEAGRRKLDAAGKPIVRIRTRYATMDLGTLRGLPADLGADAPPPRRNPFEPSEPLAREAASHGGQTKAQRVEAAKKN